MQIYNARALLDTKTPEFDLWLGCGIMTLKTSEGLFVSEADAHVLRTTEHCGCVSHWAMMEGNNVLIPEKLFHTLSKSFCATASECTVADYDFKSVEGYVLSMSHP